MLPTWSPRVNYGIETGSKFKVMEISRLHAKTSSLTPKSHHNGNAFNIKTYHHFHRTEDLTC